MELRTTEWLEPDGLGGFSSGTASTVRTRRYHALLLSAATPPTGRVVLVNGFEAWVTTAAGRFPLTSQLYLGDVRHPDGEDRIERFDPAPWPRWTYRLEDGTKIGHQVTARHGRPVVAVSFALESTPGPPRCELALRPLLSGRDYHALHHENPSLRFDAEAKGERVGFRPYGDLLPIAFLTNGIYEHAPTWYRNFLYPLERERGLDFAEDLASPGEIRFDLTRGEAIWIVSSDPEALARRDASAELADLRQSELSRRRSFASPLHRAADAYVVPRRQGTTIVAGYPWFTDWGRDTFIALRGLCLATGRLAEAESILLEWSDAVSEGMLPNRFPDHGEEPEFNSVDASLWYVVAVEDFLARSPRVKAATRRRLRAATQAILEGYARGTRFGIRADDDGLLAAGVSGVQLTWMDAKVGDWVVTPRIGKPVEIQALWLNGLALGGRVSKEWKPLFEKALHSFEERFWYAEGGYLYDVVDADHVRGANDRSLRPNQIFAVGGLPFPILGTERSRSVVDVVERRLWTPMGLRTLAPEDSRYVRHYVGGVRERDGGYHQGTVWPWLLGAFVEAWSRVRGETASVKKEARTRFLDPLLARSGAAELGHISEIADAEPPYTPRGCPFQAWSVGEALRSLEYLARLESRPALPDAKGKRVSRTKARAGTRSRTVPRGPSGPGPVV
jgi:predicted glycogen debranching enzyme